VVTGAELNAMSDKQLVAHIEQIAVFARVAPEHKLRVVQAWKSREHVVAMTGDGVNDAPAVKSADIGIAMGITGTDVTREAASMILMDDNFTSIVNAVEEGRAIYDNIQKFLIFLLACNAGEMLLMLLASLIGWPIPLLPVQLLWMNLVTDGLPALALAMEPPEPGIMSRGPRPRGESILTRLIVVRVLAGGCVLAAAGMAAFAFFNGPSAEEVALARTATFCVMVFGQLFLATSCVFESVRALGRRHFRFASDRRRLSSRFANRVLDGFPRKLELGRPDITRVNSGHSDRTEQTRLSGLELSKNPPDALRHRGHTGRAISER
jgi:P-type Ca2+ transporter type 2C